MNTKYIGKTKSLTGPIAATACAAAVVLGALALPETAHAVLNYDYGDEYFRDFDSLGTGTSTQPLGTGPNANGSVSALPQDWFGSGLFGAADDPGFTSRTPNLVVNDGSSSDLGFFNLGDSADRSLGFQGDSSYIGLEIVNKTQLLDEFTVSFDYEVWRRAISSGSSSDFQLQFLLSPTKLAGVGGSGGTFQTIAQFSYNGGLPQENPGSGPWFTDSYSMRFSDGDTLPNGSQLNFKWAPNTYLYFRLRNSTDSQSTFAIDNFAFAAIPEPSTWIAGGLLLGFAAFTQLRKRKTGAEVLA